MGKKIRTGLKGLRIAPIIKDVSASMSDDGIAKIVYGAIQKLKDIQTAELTMRTQSVDVDADDSTDTIAQCSGCDGKIQRTFFEPKELAILLDETILEDGSVVSSGEDEPGEFATGFYCKVYGGGYLAQWLFRTKYTTPDLSAESAGGEKLNPQSDTIAFKSMKRQADGVWRRHILVETEEEALAFLAEENLNKLYTKKREPQTPDNSENSSGTDETITE